MVVKYALAFFLTIVGLVANAASPYAAELVLFEDSSCGWCRRWLVEIGPSYPNTPEGRLAPLRRMHIADQRIAGIELAGPVRMTPTFVVIDNGREIGRIVGYPGDYFFPRLDELLRRLPPPPPAPLPGRSAAGLR